jgi:hypothetical protein
MSAVARALALVVIAGGAVVLLPRAASAVPADELTFVTLNTAASAYGPDSSRFWRSDRDEVSVTVYQHNWVEVRLDRGNAGISMQFVADGEALENRDYTVNREAPGVARLGYMSYSSFQGRRCDGLAYGTFSVHELAPDLSRFRLGYEMRCDGRAPMFGEVRYRLPAGSGALLPVTENVTWPERDAGVSAGTVAVPFLNTTDAPLSMTDVSVGDETKQFSLVGSTCNTLDVGESCLASVRFTPTSGGPHTGVLSARAGDVEVSIALRGSAAVGHTSFTVYREPDGSGSALNRNYGTSDIEMTVQGTPHWVQVWAGVAEGGYWSRTFAPLSGDALEAGRTYTAYGDVLANCGRTGQYATFTIHEIAFTDDAVTKLSATYEHHCGEDGPREFGSLTWRATDPAQPLPGVAGVRPGPVTDFATSAGYDRVDLTWVNPQVPDWQDTVVVMKSGAVPPKTIADGRVIYTGRDTKAVLTRIPLRAVVSFSIFARDVEGLISTPVSRTAAGASLTLNASKTRIKYGREAKFSGVLKDWRGHALSSSRIELLARLPGTSTWYEVGNVWTAENGYYSLSFAPAKTYEYWAFFDGGGFDALGAAAGGVRLPITVDVGIAVEFPTLRLGRSTRIAVAVGPTKSGAPVLLQEKVDGTWRTVARGKLNKRTVTMFSVAPSTRGKHVYRAYQRGSKHVGAGTSHWVVVTVN